MSTEPLLPSYGSITGRSWSPHPSSVKQGITISAAPIIQSLSFIIFVTTAIVSSLWAWRSDSIPNPIPPASAPLLPYFASLSLVIALGCWVGYLVFISHDAAGGPGLQRRIVIHTSVGGKMVLGIAHGCLGFYYTHHFRDSVQPDWVLVFMAVQAWWDVLLFVVYWSLRKLKQTR